MQELSKDVVALLQYLAPGFVLAWVYYGFTPHEKPSQFERVVQALVFTVIVRAVVECEKIFLELAGKLFNLGDWSEQSTLIASLITASALGLIVAVGSRRDWFYGFANKLSLTIKSGYPNEHYAAFAETPRWVSLYLKDGTRLFGWPLRWPTVAEKGHYLLTHVERSWVNHQDIPPQDLDKSGVHAILVPASDVKFIEFIN